MYDALSFIIISLISWYSGVLHFSFAGQFLFSPLIALGRRAYRSAAPRGDAEEVRFTPAPVYRQFSRAYGRVFDIAAHFQMFDDKPISCFMSGIWSPRVGIAAVSFTGR